MYKVSNMQPMIHCIAEILFDQISNTAQFVLALESLIWPLCNLHLLHLILSVLNDVSHLAPYQFGYSKRTDTFLLGLTPNTVNWGAVCLYCRHSDPLQGAVCLLCLTCLTQGLTPNIVDTLDGGSAVCLLLVFNALSTWTDIPQHRTLDLKPAEFKKNQFYRVSKKNIIFIFKKWSKWGLNRRKTQK